MSRCCVNKNRPLLPQVRPRYIEYGSAAINLPLPASTNYSPVSRSCKPHVLSTRTTSLRGSSSLLMINYGKSVNILHQIQNLIELWLEKKSFSSGIWLKPLENRNRTTYLHINCRSFRKSAGIKTKCVLSKSVKLQYCD